jgi:CTP synthase (UTP-ammonia lyase)
VPAIRIALIGDYNPTVIAHHAIPKAIELAAGSIGKPVEPTWVGTATIGQDVAGVLSGFDALWCVPASPYASTEGALRAIRFARETGRPFLGTCGGFQHALLEYARNVLGLREVGHAEVDPEAAMPFIAPLSCALVERSGAILFQNGSRIGAIYGKAEAEEEYHCSYGLNPRYEHILSQSQLKIGARDPSGEVRAVELEGHPFFLATLFQPERAALKGKAHPLVNAYVAAAAERRAVG